MSSNVVWALKIRGDVHKQLSKLPNPDQSRLIEVIETLPDNPYAGDIEKLRGLENAWRRRVGAFRIFYQLKVAERILYVYRVKRRTSSTY